jgi:hypothetical protein
LGLVVPLIRQRLAAPVAHPALGVIVLQRAEVVVVEQALILLPVVAAQVLAVR